MEITIDKIRNTLFLPFLFTLFFCLFYAHIQDNMWEKLVIALERTGNCPNTELLTVTDTTCTIDFCKWMIRFTLVIGFPYAVLLMPFLLQKVFMQEENFLKATTLSREDIKKYSKWAAYSQGVLYVSAILCLFILDVPVMSDEVLDFERKKDYVNVRKFIGGFSIDQNLGLGINP